MCMIKQILPIIAALIIGGCGGSGGGDNTPASTFSPTDPSTVFQLYPSGFITAGYRESYTLTGSDTAGGTQSGTYTTQTQAQSTFNGVAATPRSVLFDLTNTQTNAFISVTGNNYFSTALSSFSYLGYTNTTSGVTTSSASTSTLPVTGKIGDFGISGTYSLSDGTTDIVSWKITDAGSGNAYFAIFTTRNGSGGTLDSTSEARYLIAPNGDRKSVKFRMYDTSSGVTMTLSGNAT